MSRRDPRVDRAIEVLREGRAASFADAARQAGCGRTAVSDRWRKDFGDSDPAWKEPTPVEQAESIEDEESEPTDAEKALAQKVVRLDSSKASAQAEAREAKKEVKRVGEELEKTHKELSLAIDTENIESPGWLRSPKSEPGKKATLLVAYSDFHYGEVVQPEEVSYYNAYSPEIAKIRTHRFFERVVLFSRQYLAGVDYDGVVLSSLGDIISGDIHEELRATNGLTNYEAVSFALPLITEGIEMLAEEFGKVHVPCVPGNHPRDSTKPRYKKRSAHNADTMIMSLVARNFKNDDRVTFDISEGISANFEVYDTRIRIEHGDEASGGGGIQGAMLPLAMLTHKRRKQAEAEGQPFDTLLLGHWHQLMSLPSKGFAVNGCGIGYNEYARGKGFEPEPPQQALAVVTPEHGISVQAPIFVSKRSDEGW